MDLYNWVAGGQFPPGMPERFHEHTFGPVDVVIFVVGGDASSTEVKHIANNLQMGERLRGLVYSYSPENRDYRRCVELFRVSVIPSYVMVPYLAFRALLCTDGNRAWMPSSRFPLPLGEHLPYAIINGDRLVARGRSHGERVLHLAMDFLRGDLRADQVTVTVGAVSSEQLRSLTVTTRPVEIDVEIAVLFTRPAWRHTALERGVYEAFVSFGAITENVRVRVLYPSYIFDDFAIRVKEYGLIKLPAAVFYASGAEEVRVKIERDLFERLPDLEDDLRSLISDVHHSIAAGRTGIARRLVNLRRQATAAQIQTHQGGAVIQVQATNVIAIRNLRGDVVGRDKLVKVPKIRNAKDRKEPPP